MRLTAILLCILCLFTSCEATKTAPITERFSCIITCEYDGRNYEGILDRTDPQMTTVTFTSPPSVAGMVMMKTVDRVAVRLGDAEYTAACETYPDGNLVGILCEALTQAKDASVQEPFEGMCAAGVYRLSFDEQNGFPTVLELSDLPLRIRFLKQTRG